MKKIILISFFILAICSCQKEDDNGDLGGFWKLLEIAENDGITTDTKEESLFWAIQLDLIQIGNSLGRFQHTGDSLFIQMIDTKSDALVKYGVYNATDERFAVEHLNRKSMILKSKYAKLRFRKF